MIKPELLAPAGNLEKAKIALLYGADAVYIGGQKFSLRARASNFTIEQITILCQFAHLRNKKVYVTMNIIPRNGDMADLDEYLLALEQANVDAIIVSSPYIIKRAQEITKISCHLSTQISTTNHGALNYYTNMGVDRIVLAREVTLENIKTIASKSNVELEIFIHGGMCSSYSGRCVLSNYMTNRDANRGGCAHSCRWNYTLYKQKEEVYQKGVFCHIGSKDLMALDHIPALIDLGIASLKIEGRMKSTYYLATVVRAYRLMIDRYVNNQPLNIEEVVNEIKKAENRKTSDGFYRGIPGVIGHLYDNRSEEPTKEYIGYVLDYDELTKVAIIEQRNYFEVGQTVEFFGPNLANTQEIIIAMTDALTNEPLTVARHPLQKIAIKTDVLLHPHDMMRLVIKK